ncbi:MAG: hypothetical protein DHS20C13_26060 [Thermodesulfobacteriota bacterium]|nr:MAG: hypothetical protein DHS20C13_26060 [Thermodesulfobacteriota bacterium]
MRIGVASITGIFIRVFCAAIDLVHFHALLIILKENVVQIRLALIGLGLIVFPTEINISFSTLRPSIRWIVTVFALHTNDWVTLLINIHILIASRNLLYTEIAVVRENVSILALSAFVLVNEVLFAVLYNSTNGCAGVGIL